MGGTISFESEQNVGTTFYIELPFQIDHNIKHEELKTKEIKSIDQGCQCIACRR